MPNAGLHGPSFIGATRRSGTKCHRARASHHPLYSRN
jgi:hypothetical protein